jgi:hypothetical protein
MLVPRRPREDRCDLPSVLTSKGAYPRIRLTVEVNIQMAGKHTHAQGHRFMHIEDEQGWNCR